MWRTGQFINHILKCKGERGRRKEGILLTVVVVVAFRYVDFDLDAVSMLEFWNLFKETIQDLFTG